MRDTKLYRVEIKYTSTSIHYVDAYDEEDAHDRAWDEFDSRTRGSIRGVTVDIHEETDY